MEKFKVNPFIFRVFTFYFLDSCFLFFLKIRYVHLLTPNLANYRFTFTPNLCIQAD